MSSKVVVRAERLGKRYTLRQKEPYLAARDYLAKLITQPWKVFRQKRREAFWALKDVSFEINEGEAIGIIGKNGAGKSTLLKILSRITEPTEGYAELHGRVGSLLEVGTGFHPELTGRENIYFAGVILGMSRQEVRKKFDEIVEFAGVEQFLDTPLKYYSSGMAMRLAFSVAAHLEPEILVVDEVLAVGDIEFQKKCLNKMENVSQKSGRTVLFVSHQMGQIRRLCNRAIWLEEGQVRMIGPTLEVVAAYEKSNMENPEHQNYKRTRQKAFFREWKLRSPSPYLLSTFDPVEVVFVLEVNQMLHDVHHGILLTTMDSQILWGSYTNIRTLSPGLYEISYAFRMLPLPTGMFVWRVTLFDTNGLVDSWEAFPYMQVQLPNYQHSHDQWSGIMNLPHEKEIKALTPAL
ncbi:MAG: polysaccharide ABC transporter ATP-binding protein [Bacteroidia bacterium]|nr:polysaccharide ABC transporter ATP-binding protein [Bacteroidia bacterium]